MTNRNGTQKQDDAHHGDADCFVAICDHLRFLYRNLKRKRNMKVSLRSLILEVSLLDVSDEKLPCEPTDISQICHIQIDEAQEIMQEGVVSDIELSCDPMIVSTNEYYLSLVLENLISNACKFTKKGSIVVKCELKDNLFVMSITDTGRYAPSWI